MSSHHVIRENQEPAIIIQSISTGMYDTLMHLLEWSPVVACHEDFVELINSWGIKIDVIFGAMPQRLQLDYSPKLKECADSSPLSLGESLGLENAYILTQNQEMSLYAPTSSHYTIVQGDKKLYPLIKGKHSKWYPGNQAVTIHGFSTTKAKLQNGPVESFFPKVEIQLDRDTNLEIEVLSGGVWVEEEL